MATRVSLGNDNTKDEWLNQALREIYNKYGDIGSTIDAATSVSTFGRTANADANVKTTLGQFQGTVVNETFATDNDIDAIISTSASDTETITVFGMTINSTTGVMTSVTQDAVLTGQTSASLPTPLARVCHAQVKNGTFASPASDLVGVVSIYDSTDGDNAAGVPTTATAVRCIIDGTAGRNVSEKACRAISNANYWILTEFHFGLSRATGGTVNATFDLEVKELGGVWKHQGLEIVINKNAGPWLEALVKPYIIVPPNSDTRLIVTTDTADTTAYGRAEGVLAKVQTNDYDVG